MTQQREGSVLAAFGWMLVLSITLGIVFELSISVIVALNILGLLVGALFGGLFVG